MPSVDQYSLGPNDIVKTCHTSDISPIPHLQSRSSKSPTIYNIQYQVHHNTQNVNNNTYYSKSKSSTSSSKNELIPRSNSTEENSNIFHQISSHIITIDGLLDHVDNFLSRHKQSVSQLQNIKKINRVEKDQICNFNSLISEECQHVLHKFNKSTDSSKIKQIETILKHGRKHLKVSCRGVSLAKKNICKITKNIAQIEGKLIKLDRFTDHGKLPSYDSVTAICLPFLKGNKLKHPTDQNNDKKQITALNRKLNLLRKSLQDQCRFHYRDCVSYLKKINKTYTDLREAFKQCKWVSPRELDETFPVGQSFKDYPSKSPWSRIFPFTLSPLELFISHVCGLDVFEKDGHRVHGSRLVGSDTVYGSINGKYTKLPVSSVTKKTRNSNRNSVESMKFDESIVVARVIYDFHGPDRTSTSIQYLPVYRDDIVDVLSIDHYEHNIPFVSCRKRVSSPTTSCSSVSQEELNLGGYYVFGIVPLSVLRLIKGRLSDISDKVESRDRRKMSLPPQTPMHCKDNIYNSTLMSTTGTVIRKTPQKLSLKENSHVSSRVYSDRCSRRPAESVASVERAIENGEIRPSQLISGHYEPYNSMRKSMRNFNIKSDVIEEMGAHRGFLDRNSHRDNDSHTIRKSHQKSGNSDKYEHADSTDYFQNGDNTESYHSAMTSHQQRKVYPSDMYSGTLVV